MKEVGYPEEHTDNHDYYYEIIIAWISKPKLCGWSWEKVGEYGESKEEEE